MPLDPPLVVDLDTALEESTVRGLTWDESSRRVDLQLRVLALAVDGTVDADPHRVLTCWGTSGMRILLRRDRFGAIPYGPVIPVADQEALAGFFASLTFQDAMYGGSAFDDPSPVDDWPATGSLTMNFQVRPAPHCLYWFTECGREEPGGTVGYRLEGLVRFTDLAVRRRDGTPVDLGAFAADGVRWWAARQPDDPRLASRARQELIGLPWGR